MQLFLRMLSGMSYRVDPNQVVRLLLQEQSDLGLYCLHMPFCLYVRLRHLQGSTSGTHKSGSGLPKNSQSQVFWMHVFFFLSPVGLLLIMIIVFD